MTGASPSAGDVRLSVLVLLVFVSEVRAGAGSGAGTLHVGSATESVRSR